MVPDVQLFERLAQGVDDPPGAMAQVEDAAAGSAVDP